MSKNPGRTHSALFALLLCIIATKGHGYDEKYFIDLGYDKGQFVMQLVKLQDEQGSRKVLTHDYYTFYTKQESGILVIRSIQRRSRDLVSDNSDAATYTNDGIRLAHWQYYFNEKRFKETRLESEKELFEVIKKDFLDLSNYEKKQILDAFVDQNSK